MGFPSPATDYEEDRLTLNKIWEVDLNCRLIETDSGWALINTSLKPEPDGVVLATYDGRNHFVRLMGSALITEDGEAIEGDALDDVVVHGVLTHTINRIKEDDVAV
jgi:DNA polymerase V